LANFFFRLPVITATSATLPTCAVLASAAAVWLAGCNVYNPAPPGAAPAQPAALTTARAAGGPLPASASDQTASSGKFALLELFTSEGCSSTPPAEAALNGVLASAAADGRPVYAMAFHVPYWDYLGWKDTFASDPNTERQRAYSRALHHDNIYTPEIVLDGAGDLPWSDTGSANNAVNASLVTDRPAHLTLDWEGAAVRYAIADAPAGSRLYLALTERGIKIDVARGENAGRTLAHAPVVRTFVELAPGNGLATVSRPANLAADRAEVIGFVQDPVTKVVTAASRLPL
jgi:hypothetical protein